MKVHSEVVNKKVKDVHMGSQVIFYRYWKRYVCCVNVTCRLQNYNISVSHKNRIKYKNGILTQIAHQTLNSNHGQPPVKSVLLL